MNFLTVRQSIVIMILLLGTVLLFHISILSGLIPYHITWGGQLKSEKEMYAFESVSIIINLLMMLTFLFKGKFISHRIPDKWLTGLIWFYAGLFALNTVGNLFAKTTLEMIAGGMLTLISSLLCYRIARN